MNKNNKNEDKKTKKAGLLGGIQVKVIFFLVLLTTLIMFCFGVYQIFKINQELNIQLTVTNQNTAERLSKHIEVGMWTLDKESVSRSVRSEFLNQDIHAIAIKSRDQDLYVGFVKNDNGEVVEFSDPGFVNQLQSGEELISSTKRIYYQGGGILGDVIAVSTRKYNKQRIQQQYKNQIFIILTVGLILILVTFFVLELFVIRPIKGLSGIARQMSRGDYFKNLVPKSADEIGELSYALNMLNKSYQIAREQVKGS